QAPGALKTLLETYLDLGRLPTLAPNEPVSEPELRRLEAAAPAQARGLLETEGYFDADVRIERAGADAAGTPRVRVTVQPGPRATVAGMQWQFSGPLEEGAQRGDALAQATRARIERAWLLPPGAPFRSPRWGDAKNAALAQLRASG